MPVLVGAILPSEVDEFLKKVGLADYQEMLVEMIACQLEGLQLSELQDGNPYDRPLLQECRQILKLLEKPERIVKEKSEVPIKKEEMLPYIKERTGK